MIDEQVIGNLSGSILNAKRIKSKCWSIEIYKLENVLDIINRQKAENERLKERISYLEESIDCSRKEYNSLLQKLQQAKSEAIKEFAERLKRTAIGLEIGDDKKFKMTVVSTVAIDNLVREMTEVETNQRKEDKGNENHKNTHRKNICR